MRETPVNCTIYMGLTLIVTLVSICIQFGNAYLTCEVGSPSMNRKVEFNILSKKNSTGHWVTNFTVSNDSPRLLNNLKVNVVHNVDCSDGLQKNKIQGILIAPPPVPSDYTLFPGVGYYKLYPKVSGFDKAENTCIKEGAHLAIVNSKAENDVIRSICTELSTYLGFHRDHKGEFITVLGQSLNTTGFNGWLPGEPNNSGGKENCGTFYAVGEGGFNDTPCDREYPFICEFELGWA